ncbi:hypothetical protein TI04_00710 [Achromatium sp. WMS2]|nr:hypothetical protein TI04_00710 [Achromatium sp. WMS2]
MPQLKIEITSYWHSGTGRGRGSQVDAITHRNIHQLPSLPGRTIKGLLRDAVYRWEQFGGYANQQMTNAPTITEGLFGPFGGATWPGLLRLSDAQLPLAEREALIGQQPLIAGLYRNYFSTAIDHKSGVAQESSLRGMELVIPLTLYAQIELIPNAKYLDLQPHWYKLLSRALPLVQAVGSHRTRGLGRATLTLEGGA